jgi:hypothetical protein
VVFVIVVESVYCAVNNEFLYKADYASSIKGAIPEETLHFFKALLERKMYISILNIPSIYSIIIKNMHPLKG